jgi:hypothetical protein
MPMQYAVWSLAYVVVSIVGSIGLGRMFAVSAAPAEPVAVTVRAQR